MNKFKTESKHPDFGVVHVGCSYKDKYFFRSGLTVRQLNDRLHLTREQVIELRDMLSDIIEKEKVNEQ